MDLKNWFSSKKAKGFMTGLLALVLAHFTGFSPEEQEKILWLVAAYLGSQGAVDFGKGQVKASAPVSPPSSQQTQQQTP